MEKSQQTSVNKLLIIVLSLTAFTMLFHVTRSYRNIYYQKEKNEETMEEDTVTDRFNKREEKLTLRDTTLTNLSPDVSSLGVQNDNEDYPINCSNINEIKIIRLLGRGTWRNVHLGYFHGTKVAVKTMSYKAQNTRECVQTARRRFHNCRILPYMMALNEIVLYSQLQHPGFIQLLGYCVKDVVAPPRLSGDNEVTQQSMVSVFEYGTEYSQRMKLTPTQRLQFAADLCDIVDYMEHSAIGSLYMEDFNSSNVLIHSGHLKLSDIERLSAIEPQCRENKQAPCLFDLPCSNGTCVGHNAKIMMMKLKTHFFPHLLSGKDVSENIANELTKLHLDTKMSASQLKHRIYKIIDKI